MESRAKTGGPKGGQRTVPSLTTYAFWNSLLSSLFHRLRTFEDRPVSFLWTIHFNPGPSTFGALNRLLAPSWTVHFHLDRNWTVPRNHNDRPFFSFVIPNYIMKFFQCCLQLWKSSPSEPFKKCTFHQSLNNRLNFSKLRLFLPNRLETLNSRIHQTGGTKWVNTRDQNCEDAFGVVE